LKIEEVTAVMKCYKIAIFWILNAVAANFAADVFDGGIGKSTWKLIETLQLPCQKFTFTEVFHRPGCDAVKVTNHFCGGRCYSIFYSTLPRSCYACFPNKVDFLSIKFNCTDTEADFLTHRTVEVVKSCRCQRIKCLA